jgi:hypothetical protein
MARVTLEYITDKIPHLLVHNRRDNVGGLVMENLTAGTGPGACRARNDPTLSQRLIAA